MVRILIKAVFILVLSFVLPLRFSAQTLVNHQPKALAIVNVNIIDTKGGKSKPKMTVLITGNRISAIGKTKALIIPKDTFVIDATNKYLIPGLWDMHTHIWDKDSLFPAYLANGITGVRDMGTVIEPWVKWRKQAESGEITGLRAIIAGKIIDGFKPFFYFFVQATDEAKAREYVRTFKSQGADFIKVYDRLPKNLYLAIVDEAKRQNMPFGGHVPVEIKASEASNLGQKSIEHLTGIALESSMEEARLQAEAIKAFNDLRKEGLKPEELSSGFDRAYKLARNEPLDTYDEKKAQRLFKIFRGNKTWQVPTLVVRDYLEDEAQKNRITENLKYFPAFFKDMVLPEKNLTAVELETTKRRARKEREIIRAMRRSRVKFLAGSDAPNPYSVPGFGLHDELALLVETGFTPLEALQATTLNPAEYLEKLNLYGTVEPSKIADLVLLEADPLTNIDNTKKIAAVIVNGKFLEKAKLQDMLAQLEIKANKK
jgi:imidazolonepropionase-like amidohydrolase